MGINHSISIDNYAMIVSNRMSAMQNLQSAASGFLVTLLAALSLCLYNLDSVDKFFLAWGSKLVFLLMVVVFFCHLYSLYQVYGVMRCAAILGKLEDNYRGLKYFYGGPYRHLLYFISHSFPTVFAILLPLFLWGQSESFRPIIIINLILVIISTGCMTSAAYHTVSSVRKSNLQDINIG